MSSYTTVPAFEQYGNIYNNPRYIGRFHPKYLFSATTQGAIYDYDDFAYLYQKADGSVPITALEQPVGLMLDKRYGGLAALGSELVSPIDFNSGWTASGAAVTVNSATSLTAAGVSNYYKAYFTVGKWYRITINATFTGSALNLYNSTSALNVINSSTISSGGTHTFLFLASATQLNIRQTTAGTLTINSISAKELPGLHAYQSTDAARPVLSARYNLLTYTEDVTPRAGAWAHSNVAAYSNQAEGVCRVQTAGSGTESFISAQASGVAVNQTLRARIQIRSVDYSGTLNVDLQEAISPFPSTTQTITPTAEWQTVEVTRTLVTAGVSSAYIRLRKGSATVGGTFEFRFPDLRLTADANSRLPAYQRVTTATDYDSAGFPRFLRIDATDDFMQTASVDPGTDKVFVCAGVTKMSDAATAVLVESSTVSNTTAGTFAVFAPGGIGAATYAWRTRGTVDNGQSTAGSYASPASAVLSGIGNIAGDSLVLRVNGAEAINSTADQGTGNYTAQPLYIGARTGSSLRLNNGRIYPMVIAFKLPTAGEIAATEQWLRARCPAVF